MLFLSIVLLAITILMIVSNWKIFEKAGEDGWKSLIPIYNTFIYFKISWNRSMCAAFYILAIMSIVLNNEGYGLAGSSAAVSFSLLLLALVIIIYIVVCVKLAIAFGENFGYGIGLAFLPFIFYPLLAFGDIKYERNNSGKTKDGLEYDE
jgi:hypothetical protein